MVTSGFQFTSPVLDKLNFVINEEFDLKKDKEIKFEIKSNVNVKRVKDSNEALVELNVIVGEKEVTPFLIDATQKAMFRWDDEQDKNMVDILLSQNAPALLMSYLRPIIANVTAASQYPAYNLPFMNFTK